MGKVPGAVRRETARRMLFKTALQYYTPPPWIRMAYRVLHNVAERTAPFAMGHPYVGLPAARSLWAQRAVNATVT